MPYLNQGRNSRKPENLENNPHPFPYPRAVSVSIPYPFPSPQDTFSEGNGSGSGLDPDSKFENVASSRDRRLESIP